MRKAIDFLEGVFWGTLIGVTASILLAPASGDRMKQDLREHTERVLAEARKAASERRVELEAELAAARKANRP